VVDDRIKPGHDEVRFRGDARLSGAKSRGSTKYKVRRPITLGRRVRQSIEAIRLGEPNCPR
jgi:hypothetical protein